MTKKFFCEDAPLKADIERYRAKQKELEDRIHELEALHSLDECQSMNLRVSRYFLNLLLKSKVEVVSKIGKKGIK